MNISTSNLKDKELKELLILWEERKFEQHASLITNELNVRVDEIQAFYTTTEDIFRGPEERLGILHRYWDRHKKLKTPSDFKCL